MQMRSGLARTAMAALACASLTMGAASRESQTEATRKVAQAFLHQLFAEQDSFGAYRKYAAPDFKQHNPEMADGIAGREAFFTARAQQSAAHPGKLVNVYNLVLVDADLFAIHHHAFGAADDRGRVFVDIWRVADGRIVEHWDVIQPYPTSMLHANGMGCGRGERFEEALKLESSPEHTSCPAPDVKASRDASIAVINAYTAGVRSGDVRGSILKWFAPDYRQHSPNIADGIQGAIAYLEHEYGAGATQQPRATAERILAEGDYVLAHRQVMYPGATRLSTNVDIFRIRGGKISEHWDVKQLVPESSANKNGMW